MGNVSLIYLAVLVPVIGSFLLPLLGRISEILRNVVALVLISVSLLCSLILVPEVMSGTPISVPSQMLGMTLFYADCLAVFMAIVSSLIGAVIVFYSWGYISHYEHRDEYYGKKFDDGTNFPVGLKKVGGFRHGMHIFTDERQSSVGIFGMGNGGPFLKVGSSSLAAPTNQTFIPWKPGIYFVGE